MVIAYGPWNFVCIVEKSEAEKGHSLLISYWTLFCYRGHGTFFYIVVNLFWAPVPQSQKGWTGQR